jgi:uncharacterized protein (TIGR02421 family)
VTRPRTISPRLIRTVCDRLARNERVRRSLPLWGRLHIDRQLPFLCIYRQPADRDDPETERFVTGEASYLTAPGDRQQHADLSLLTRRVVDILGREFGAFLLLEVWAGPEVEGGDVPLPPRFHIHHAKSDVLASTAAVLEQRLSRIRIQKLPARVSVISGAAEHPAGLPALLRRAEAAALGCHWLGVEIAPIWRRAEAGTLYPLVRRALSLRFGKALKRALFEFTRARTPHRPAHFHALGKRATVKAVWEVDRRLAGIDDAYDVILLMTPANPDAAYATFKRTRFARAPSFLYRPIPTDPALLKRRLFDIRIEQVEDPTLAQLFREKRRELDLRLNLILERETSRALYCSLQLFGRVDDVLLRLARRILRRIPPRAREAGGGGRVDAEAFADRARAELEHYRRRRPDMVGSVEIREDLAGLMVSRGRLLVGRSTQVPAARVEGLLQHEVGTHVLTYFNGGAQPFQQLRCGLAGYDELQEGLAVFAEYLVGDLSRPRLRLLAARVVAARGLLEGTSFVETFRRLHDEYGFEQKTAYTVALRVHRGGGLTKDAIYLRGLVRLFEYLQGGGDLEPLYVGKIAVEHVPVVRELQRRGVLHEPALRPRFLDDPATQARLERVRNGLTVLDLAKGSK